MLFMFSCLNPKFGIKKNTIISIFAKEIEISNDGYSGTNVSKYQEDYTGLTY